MDYWHGAGVQQMIDAAQNSADIDAVNAAWQKTADILKARITERDARIAQLEQEVQRLTPSIFAELLTPNTTELQNKNKELTKKLDEATKSLTKINERWDAESWSQLHLMGILISKVVSALAECLMHLDRMAQAPEGSSRGQAHLAMLAEAMREYMATRKGARYSVFALSALKDACLTCRDAICVEIKALDATLDG